MARGTIRKNEDRPRKPYEVVVDLGLDPVTRKRRQRSQSFRTKREAEAKLAEWLAEIDKGVAVDRSKQTVGELLEFWLETYAQTNVRGVTLEGYERTCRYYVIPALGHILVQKLTPDQLQGFYAQLLAKGIGARTVQLCHMRIKQALKMALRMGLVARNVADLVTAPKVTQREMTIWDTAQVKQFLAVTHDSSYGPIWPLILTTGMRRGEVLGLRWQDVDFANGMIAIRQTVGVRNGAPEFKPPKSKGSRRTLPIPSPIIAMLREHRAAQNERRLALGADWHDHDLVFAAANGNPINPNNIVRDYDRLVDKAGLPRIRVHDLRHTHVSLSLQLGANIKAVSQRVGHARTSTTLDIYAHVLGQQHQEVSDKIGAAFFGPMAGGSDL